MNDRHPESRIHASNRTRAAPTPGASCPVIGRALLPAAYSGPIGRPGGTLPPSPHEFHRRDRVVRDGMPGVVTEARALHAVVRWADGCEEEVEQFDGCVQVERRAERDSHD